MPKHTLDDLRDHLFETMAALRDPKKPMDIDRAKAVSDVAQTIINSAKVEVEHMRVNGAKGGSGFLALPSPTPAEGEGDTPAAASTGAGKGVQRTVEERPGVQRTVEERPGVRITRNQTR